MINKIANDVIFSLYYIFDVIIFPILYVTILYQNSHSDDSLWKVKAEYIV